MNKEINKNYFDMRKQIVAKNFFRLYQEQWMIKRKTEISGKSKE